MSNVSPILSEVQNHVRTRRRSIVRWYSGFLLHLPIIRSLARLAHRKLNDIQYDPLNPHNRTHDNPEGYVGFEDAKLAAQILADKTLIDKVESYFKLRPFSNGIMYFFVIAGAAAGIKHNPQKMMIVLTVIFLLMPLLTSRQRDFEG